MKITIGDRIRIQARFSICEYLYCGKYENYRILYGGCINSEKHYILREDNLFSELKKVCPNFGLEKIKYQPYLAQAKKRSFLMQLGQGTIKIEDCLIKERRG